MERKIPINGWENLLMILVKIHQCVLNENFYDMKLWKFQVEGISWENIFGHLQGGNFELKIMFILF